MMDHTQPVILAAERVVIWTSTLELLLRFLAEWPRWSAPLTNGWYLFDLTIVTAGPLMAGSVVQVLCLLRVLRVISVVPSLQRLVGAVMVTLPSMGSIMLLLGLLFYVYGIIAPPSSTSPRPSTLAHGRPPSSRSSRS